MSKCLSLMSKAELRAVNHGRKMKPSDWLRPEKRNCFYSLSRCVSASAQVLMSCPVASSARPLPCLVVS